MAVCPSVVGQPGSIPAVSATAITWTGPRRPAPVTLCCTTSKCFSVVKQLEYFKPGLWFCLEYLSGGGGRGGGGAGAVFLIV